MPKSKKTAPARKVRVPKKTDSSNTIMLIVGGVLVLLVLFVLARNLKNSTQLSKNNTVPADTLNDIPSTTTTGASNISTTAPPVSSQPGKPGWNLNFNANTAFGLIISAGVNDQGELYIRPDFQTNLKDLAPKPSLAPSPSASPAN